MNKIALRIASMILALVLTLGTVTPGRAKSQNAAQLPTNVENSAIFSQQNTPAFSETVYNDKSSAFVYSSGWTDVTETRAYNGSFKLTQTVGSSVTFGFTGQTFAVIYKTGPLFGKMDVFVDGQLVGTINQYTSTATFQKKWSYGGTLTSGSHTLKLVYASPSNSRVSVDAVSVQTATTSTLPSPTPTLSVVKTATPVITSTLVPTQIVTNTPVPTQVSVQPSATVTTAVVAQPTNAAPQSQPTSGGGMWISSSEIMSLPTSGAAWDQLRSTAYGTWGIADLKNQDNKHAINTLAGALVYARTGDAAVRTKVRDALLAAKRTLDESGEWQTTNGVLAAGRQLGAYVISADLIGLKDFDAASDNEFRSWLTSIRTTSIGTHGRWKTISYTCENSPNNWGTFACASRIAASIYLGDTTDVQRAASIIRAYFGERSYYPANAPGSNGYFQHTGDYQASWACDDAVWVGINPPCTKSGADIDGALVEDASRGGGCCILQGPGTSYSWEALQGLFVSAELLHRTGGYDPYNWSNQALKRAMNFMQRSGWGITGPATYVPWMANFRYGTSYAASTVSGGRIMSWGEWLYKR